MQQTKNKKRPLNRQGGQQEDKKPKTDGPFCRIQNKNHEGKCRYEGKPYHNCGEFGHYKLICPKPPQQQKWQLHKPKVQGKVNSLTIKDAEAHKQVMEGALSIFGTFVRCLFDSGSTHSFVCPSFTPSLHVTPSFLDVTLCIATHIGAFFETNLVY